MKALEQRKYCGLMQNEIQNKFGVFASATSKGDCLFVKQADILKIKGFLPMVRANKYVYIIDVTKTNLKKLNLL